LDTPKTTFLGRAADAGLDLLLLPVAAVVGSAWALAWIDYGSIAAADWLPYAVGTAFVLAVVLLAGVGSRPSWPVVAAVSALVGLAAWDAASVSWSPLPDLARDEALLVLFYAVAFALGVLCVRSEAMRDAATIVVVAGGTAIAVGTPFALLSAARPEELYVYRRLDFPVSYPNAVAAAFLIAFWPAVAVAARPSAALLVRAAALGGATAMLGGWLLAQSKGGAVGLAASALVVFAVARSRLRLLVPALVAGVLAAAAGVALTAPFRATDEGFASSIRRAAKVDLAIVGAAVLLGLVYAFVDRRMNVGPRIHRAIGIAVATLVLAAAAAGVGAFFVEVDHPGRYVQDRWRSFKHLPEHETGGTHLLTLGSNRYDFWRVAAGELKRRPLAGIGARGFEAAYFQKGRSRETPARAHSVEADTLAETGLVGFALLVLAVGLPFLVVARRARSSVTGAGILGASAYWGAHASVDWMWTFPAVSLPFFVLLGIGLAEPEAPRLRGAIAAPAGVLAAAAAILAFAPPWLAAKFTSDAYTHPERSAHDLQWARRLDPLSVRPLEAEAALSIPPGDIPPLDKAVRKQPRALEPHYELGLAYLRSGRRADAARELRIAHRLAPRDPDVAKALRRAS
jgi:O-Antigen ligase